MSSLEEAYIYLVGPESNLIEMANIPSDYTGIQPTIMVSSKYGHDGKASNHSARIKVSNINGKFSPTDHFVMTIEDTPRVIGNCKLKQHQVNDISDWIKLNHSHLMNVWHNGLDMDPVDLVSKIKKI